MRAGIIAGLVAVTVLWAGPAGDDDKPLTQAERVAKGKDLVDSICFWCHEPELMNAKRLDRYQWAELITPMIYEGAPVTEEEFEWIVEYLTANFGPVEEE